MKSKRNDKHKRVNQDVYAPLLLSDEKVREVSDQQLVQSESEQVEPVSFFTEKDTKESESGNVEQGSSHGHSTHEHSTHEHSTHERTSRRRSSHSSSSHRSYSRRHSSESHSEGRHGKRRSSKRIPVWAVVFGVIFLLIAALVGGLFILRYQGKRSLLEHEAVEGVEITAPVDAVVEEQGKTITYKGKKYQKNDAVVSILCMGIDTQVLKDDERQIGENGQADTLFVAALDTGTGELNLVNISRDAMVDVDVYNIQNQYAATENMQICLAYAYGDGGMGSCENTIKSVSRLLYGIPIDAYAAIDIPAISELNDAIGGVEVDVLEDMTDWNPEWVQGAHVLLQGSQATTYVRSRYSEGEKAAVDANNPRMARQRQYLTNFINKTLSATKSNPSVPVTLYNVASPYMETNITVSEVTYLASLLLEHSFGSQNIVNVPGEVVMGEEYAEYHVDEEELYQIILDVFYKPVSSL